MEENKKEKTFKDLFSSITEEKGNEENKSLSFNSINKKSKEEKNESLNSLIKESTNEEKDLFNNILKETPSLIQEEETPVPEESANNEPEITNPFFTEEKQEEVIDNPFFNNEGPKPIISEPIIEEQPIIEEPIFKDKEETIEEPVKEEIIEEPKEEVIIPEEEPTVEEPIVEEEKDDINTILDENPFFIDSEENEELLEEKIIEDKINLVENKKHEVKNNEISKIDTSNAKHFNVKIVKKKDPPIKFVIGVLSYALFIWLLLIGIGLLVYVADLKIREAKGDTSPPTYSAYVVLTGSMLPEIQVNDVVVTKRVDAKDLKEKDVITFLSSDTRFAGTKITHRIIKKYYDSEKKQYTFQTKGDNNNVADSALVQEGNILGKVILKIPKLGYLQTFLAAEGGWIIVILLPCLLVISYDTVKLIKGLRRKKYKNIKVQK